MHIRKNNTTSYNYYKSTIKKKKILIKHFYCLNVQKLNFVEWLLKYEIDNNYLC